MHGIGAIENLGKSAADDRALLTEQGVQETALSSGIPGESGVGAKGTVISVINGPLRRADGLKSKSRIENVSRERRLFLLLDEGIGDQPAGGRVNHDGLQIILLRRRGLDTVGSAVVESQRRPDAPGILHVKIAGVLIGDVAQDGAQRLGLEIRVADRQDADVIDNTQE